MANEKIIHDFETLYLKNVHNIYELWTPEMQADLAQNNSEWSFPHTNFREYLVLSVERYKICLQQILRENAQKICDVGGFWGAFPLTLRQMGFQVSMTEATEFYSGSFEKLFEFLAKEGVHIHSANLFDEKPNIELEAYDFITLLAVLEHYPHSPKTLFQNIRAMLVHNGKLLIEVPNILYFPKRMKHLRGESPLTHIKNINESKAPFIGHHHEYTLEEVIYLEDYYGFKHIREEFLNYSNLHCGLKHKIRYFVEFLSYKYIPQTREEIFSLSEKI